MSPKLDKLSVTAQHVPMPPTATPDVSDRRALLDHQIRALDGEFPSLDALVEARRNVGRSWQRIADEVVELTGTPVQRQSLHAWYPEHRELP